MTDDSTRTDIKQDYHNLFYTFIGLRDLYAVYEAAEPLRGYDHSLEYRVIMQHENYVLAVKGGSRHGEAGRHETAGTAHRFNFRATGGEVERQGNSRDNWRDYRR